jgi:hypothetical protein
MIRLEVSLFVFLTEYNMIGAGPIKGESGERSATRPDGRGRSLSAPTQAKIV